MRLAGTVVSSLMLKMDRCAMTFQTVKRSFVIVFYQIEIVALLDVGFLAN